MMEHFLMQKMCRTLVSQLLVHQRIETTLPRAKELRRLADQVVTISKEVSCALWPPYELILH